MKPDATNEWGDREDEYSERIAACHPDNNGSHRTYALASRLVGNRHSKCALIDLVNFLLIYGGAGE